MFVGRALFLLGMAFVLFSIYQFILIPFSNSVGDLTTPMFGLLNGFIAMGVGEIVIDLNHRRNMDEANK
ncbi:hypothetical protein [Pseudalkalibacillus salsuginis]|uniref:hypothetical protein n=1 Tax=Pseudalkalibacillus salsuginis TaxID=2910972 RepID=UPI001F1637A5|nr:hypothetical protein [Pseudalkalibacillus salsuginis]MCF6411578.1 hypothetical protein [Pseudalkalibacillus salsuginis]